MLQLLLGMLFELIGDVHELRALQNLRINYVSDNSFDIRGKDPSFRSCARPSREIPFSLATDFGFWPCDLLTLSCGFSELSLDAPNL